jgi:hypothetical protein
LTHDSGPVDALQGVGGAVDVSVTLVKWSRFNISFLADFSLVTEEIGYEEEAFFAHASSLT